jgi:3-oxoacyl-[acyl-carrier protein] reductase
MRPVALITGGTRGIGLGIALQLAKDGFDLILNGVRPESQVQDVLDDLKKNRVKIGYIQGDIGKGEDRKKILEHVKYQCGRLNILVNNAGVAPRVRADVLEVAEDDFDHLMDINLKGTFFLTRDLAQWMISQKKLSQENLFSIINITSVSAVLGSTNRVAYCISKAGLSMMSKVFAIRLAEEEIPVYEIRPGIIETDMTEKVKTVYQGRIEAGLTLEKRMGLPNDVGKAVAILAKGEMSYATGQVITIDGGLTVERL